MKLTLAVIRVIRKYRSRSLPLKKYPTVYSQYSPFIGNLLVISFFQCCTDLSHSIPQTSLQVELARVCCCAFDFNLLHLNEFFLIIVALY